MTASQMIGNVVWQFRYKIFSGVVFVAGFGGYMLLRSYVGACGDGKRGLLAILNACVAHWSSGR